MDSPQAQLSFLGEKADSVDSPIHAKASIHWAQTSALAPSRREAGRRCAGEKGQQLGRWGEQYPRNTAVAANVLQQSCGAPELPAYKCTAGGAGWRLPSWAPAVARVGPIPACPDSLEEWPRLAC